MHSEMNCKVLVIITVPTKHLGISLVNQTSCVLLTSFVLLLYDEKYIG